MLIASDHGGVELKELIKTSLINRGVEVEDLGTYNGDSVDYPDYGAKLAGLVSSDERESGILICGTGIGMSIVANKFPRVRAALVTNEFMAQMAKQHNNANILVLGGRVLNPEEAISIVNTWLDTEFEGSRHQRRLDLISDIEQRSSCPK